MVNRLNEFCIKYEILEHYTKINLIFLTIALITKNPLLCTFVFTNTHAIFVSFHASQFIDENGFDKYRIRCKDSWFQFWWKNMIGHIIPLIIVYFLPVSYTFAPIIGFISCGVHFAWAFLKHKTICLNKSYVDFEKNTWYMLWFIAAYTHIFTGFILHHYKKM